MTQLKDLRRRWSRDESYKAAYDALDEEFQLARAMEAALSAGEDLAAVPVPLARALAAKNVTIRLSLADLARARTQAERRGLRYQTYVKMLLHQALTADARRLA